MKLTTKLAAIAVATLGTVTALTPALAAIKFGQQEVDQSKFIAIAVPLKRSNSQQLTILEQVSNKRPCWQESRTSSGPVKVNPLLLTFNFTGICSRATDSNGYSIRIAGTDLGMRYNISLQRTATDTLLVGTDRRNPYSEPVVIGRTGGITNDISKIQLTPGWRFTKRTYNGKALGHIYLTNDTTALLPR